MDKISEKGIKANKSVGENIITDEYEISKSFNKLYINIVEKNCGKNLIK